MTIKELSEKSGISEQYLTRIEKDDCKKISVSHVFALADGLCIKPSLLCNFI